MIELLESWNNGQKTIITATHQLEILSEISERAIVLERGAVVADASPAEILANTELLESANLIHSHRHLHGGVPHKHPSPYLRHEHRKH
jgi:cobalt/nickel transport system ATP-binding protein